MQFLKKSAPFGVLLAVSILAGCQTSTQIGSNEVKLSAAEVRSTFIGREWRGGSGTFFHSKEGASRYTADKGWKVTGSHTLSDDGVLCTVNDANGRRPNVKTCYTFYRDGDKYRYFHDRSGKFWPAYIR